MKNALSVSRKLLLLTGVVLLSAFVFTSCSKDDNDEGNNNMYTISGAANGNQMVPAVQGNGTATITGTYNANTRVMNYTVNWVNLSGAPTSGGFYTGAAGQAGVALGTPWTLGANLGATGTHAGQMTLTNEQQTQLLNGAMYYTLGTATNANGEVRGQITATR